MTANEIHEAIKANVEAFYADEKTYTQFSNDNGILHGQARAAGLDDALSDLMLADLQAAR